MKSKTPPKDTRKAYPLRMGLNLRSRLEACARNNYRTLHDQILFILSQYVK